jgi:hypothetical protein
VRFVEPTALAGGLAGLLARGHGAVALALGATRVGRKEGLTMLALACGTWTSHWPASPQANHRKIRAWKEENSEEKAGQRRVQKTEEGDKYHIRGRRRNSLIDNFNRTVYSQFQDTAETRCRYTARLWGQEELATQLLYTTMGKPVRYFLLYTVHLYSIFICVARPWLSCPLPL